MSNKDTIRLKIPHQDLDSCSSFDCTEAAVDQWINSLPMANLGQTTRQLYQVLTELNRVILAPAKRMMVLEKLRTPVHFASAALSKHYLNQPISLPEQPRKVSELAQALHNLLATGYRIAANNSLALNKHSILSSKPQRLMATAINRAITEHTINIQRHYQLYQTVNADVWHTLHQLYLLSEEQKVLNQEINDPLNSDSNIEEIYIKALLLGCSKPNQLRQEDFSTLSNVLTEWGRHCSLVELKPQSLFVVDTDSDLPPIYNALYDATTAGELLALHTQPLVAHLKKLREAIPEQSLKIQDSNRNTITRDLLSHLILSWGSVSKRTFMRLEANDKLDLSLGLSATHHFISGEIDFESLIEERGAKALTMKKDNLFLKTSTELVRPKDVWDSPYESNVGQTDVALESIDFHIEANEKKAAGEDDKYHSHNVQMINSSAHGYCIKWPADHPAQIKAGEIVGLKENQSNNWSIAVIRWVNHDKETTQIGLELISPSAAPYGARIIKKTGGDGEYVRVLILPEITAIKRPVTLLTPKVPFVPSNKVIINQRGKEAQIYLNKLLNDQGAFNLFEFKKMTNTLKAPKQKDNTGYDTKNANKKDNFDSLWGKL